MPARARPLGRWLFGAAFSLAALAYVPRVGRTLAAVGDSAELVAAAAVWGVPHPPGYPLYTAIAHLFTRMPWFDVAFRVHLTSALFHAMTVGFVACVIEVLSGSVAAAAIGAAALALGRIFFQGSLYAEVFPLGDLLFACIFWLAARARGAVRTGPPSARSWIALAVALGLAFGHHPMIVLALPAVAILVARPRAPSIRHRPWSCAALAALTVAIALGSYALVA